MALAHSATSLITEQTQAILDEPHNIQPSLSALLAASG